MKKVGVLALQGDFEAHSRALARAGSSLEFRRRLEQIQQELQSMQAKADPARMQTLLQERVRLKRALMDPGLTDPGEGSGQ